MLPLPSLTRRRALALVMLATVAAGVAYSRAPEPQLGRAVMAQLADGAWLADSLAASDRASNAATPASATVNARRNARAIALGYLERQRLGLGSPFRLADQARQDPRLDSILRRRLGWALLARTMHEGGYLVDAAVLAPLSPDAGGAADARAVRHLAFIERAMGSAGDPRAAELALRIAYRLAESERLLPVAGSRAVGPVLALVRDRITAAEDARRLLWSAQEQERDALDLLAEWRQFRELQVERPASESHDRALEPTVATLAGELLDSLRVIAAGEPGDTSATLASSSASHPLLGEDAARRLAVLSRAAPPLAPVVVSARAQRSGLPDAVRDRFLAGARNEEGLVAEHARLRHRSVAGAVTARIVMNAAVALRTHAQAPVWFPGRGGPSATEIASALGLREVEFERGIPASWRPYHLAMLQRSFADLQAVLPAASLQGARVHFVLESPRSGALALHDPRSRTIVLPIATASGTLAHEIAHDMDWQAARRLYARRGTYSTDRAVAEEHGRLAASVRGLTAASLVAPEARNGYRAPHDTRPAEVFARNVDWFVAVALAREGRMNGDLTAVQDEVLTGYASVLPGEVGGPGAPALMGVLADVAYVREPLRSWFLATWGRAREDAGLPLVRRLLDEPLGQRRHRPGSAHVRALRDPSVVLDLALAACAGREATAHDAASERLATLAAESRARGVLRARIESLRARGESLRADALEGVGPWSGEDGARVVERVRSAMLRSLGESHASRPLLPGAGTGCVAR